MRVLMLSWEYPPHVVGGLGKHVAELVPALAALGVEVHVVTPDLHETRSELSGRSTVHRVLVPKSTVGGFYAQTERANRALAAYALTVLRDDGPFDIIHNHDWLTSFAARDLKQQSHIPLTATIHATERGRGRGLLASKQAEQIDQAEWWLTYEAWRVICCTDFMSHEIQSYFGVPADKLDIIPNGVTPEVFDALENKDLTGFRQRYASPDENLVMYVGRIVYEKGIEVLLRSVPAVLASVPHTRVVIAGKGPELERMRELVASLNLSEVVQLPGFISDEDRNMLFKIADCAVFPSLYEPFGIVALEAMAARTPIVVSEVGGLREVVKHAETGITIYPDNVESCAWGIVHTLQHPDWATQRAEAAYREVLEIYNWHKIAEQTLAVYKRIAHERLAVHW